MVNLAISSHKLWTAIIGDSESNEGGGGGKEGGRRDSNKECCSNNFSSTKQSNKLDNKARVSLKMEHISLVS